MPLVSSTNTLQHTQTAKQSHASRPLKFGFLTQAFATLEKEPLWDLAVKDAACFILPQAGITRTKNELLDFLPNALGLLSVTVFGTLALPWLMRFPVSRMTGIARQSLKAELPKIDLLKNVSVKEQLARLGVSFGFFFPFAAGFMAVPFFRNWLTLKRTGSIDFEQLIGLEKRKIHTLSPTEQKMERKKQLKAISWIMGAGSALSAASVLGFSLLAKKASFAPKVVERIGKLFEQFATRGSRSDSIKGNLAILLFWLAPAYLGWMISARSRNEKIEQAVKALNSIFWFSLVTPLAVNPVFLKQYEKLGVHTGMEDKAGWTRYYKGHMPSYAEIQKLEPSIKETALKIWKKQSIASWVIPVVMLALTPQLLNIHFTKKRYAKSIQRGAVRPELPHHEHGGFKRASFAGSLPNSAVQMVKNPFAQTLEPA